MNLSKRGYLGDFAWSLLITGACSFAAQAQEKTDATLSAGGFIFKPAVTLSQEYNSNIYSEGSNEDGDFITRVKPQVTIKKAHIEPHEVEIKLDAEQLLYASDSSDNALNYHAAVKTHYKFSPLSSWTNSGDFRHINAPRGDNASDPANVADGPIAYDRFTAKTSWWQKFGDLIVSPRLTFLRFDFEDGRRNNGTVIDEDYRDRNELYGGGRLSYDIAYGTSIFGDIELQRHGYDDHLISDRDSSGGEYLTGLRYRPSRAFMIEVGGGYLSRDYDGVLFDDIHTFDAAARMEWKYEEGGSVKFSVDRRIVEASDASIGGAVRTDARFSVARQLWPDLIGTFEARYLITDFAGGNTADNGIDDRRDDYYRLGGGIEYLLNDRVSLLGNYYFADNDSNDADATYSENVILLGIKGRF